MGYFFETFTMALGLPEMVGILAEVPTVQSSISTFGLIGARVISNVADPSPWLTPLTPSLPVHSLTPSPRLLIDAGQHF